MPRPAITDKIQGRHRDRLAVVYIRQSTLQQVGRHPESTRLQYALAERAQQLGWARERIVVIDDDLGRSGSSAEARPGFQRLVAEVGLGHVGLVLGVERCPGSLAPVATGISYSRSALCSKPSSPTAMASSTRRPTMIVCSSGSKAR